MTDSVAKRIILEVYNRLSRIQVANGFNTDIGFKVFRGRMHFDVETDQFPCCSIFSREEVEASGLHNERMEVVLHIDVEVYALLEGLNPLDLVEDMVADVKHSVLSLASRNVNGLAEDLRYAGREEAVTEDGSNVVGVRVHLQAFYPEIYGDPYTVI